MLNLGILALGFLLFFFLFFWKQVFSLSDGKPDPMGTLLGTLLGGVTLIYHSGASQVLLSVVGYAVST